MPDMTEKLRPESSGLRVHGKVRAQDPRDTVPPKFGRAGSIGAGRSSCAILTAGRSTSKWKRKRGELTSASVDGEYAVCSPASNSRFAPDLEYDPSEIETKCRAAIPSDSVAALPRYSSPD